MLWNKNFIKENPKAYVIVDPVLGDNGNMYPTFNKEICMEMKNLIKNSNLITPNITEACLLLDKEFNDNFSEDEVIEMAKKYSYQHYSWVERSTTWTNLLEDVESICRHKLGEYKEAYELGKEALKHEPTDERLLRNVAEFAASYIKELEDKQSKK